MNRIYGCNTKILRTPETYQIQTTESFEAFFFVFSNSSTQPSPALYDESSGSQWTDVGVGGKLCSLGDIWQCLKAFTVLITAQRLEEECYLYQIDAAEAAKYFIMSKTAT